MTSKALIAESLSFVDGLNDDGRRVAEFQSMAIFPVLKLFGALEGWPQTYGELSNDQRCVLAYLALNLAPAMTARVPLPVSAMCDLMGKQVIATIDMPEGRRDVPGKLVDIQRRESLLFTVETEFGTFHTSEPVRSP